MFHSIGRRWSSLLLLLLLWWWLSHVLRWVLWWCVLLMLSHVLLSRRRSPLTLHGRESLLRRHWWSICMRVGNIASRLLLWVISVGRIRIGIVSTSITTHGVSTTILRGGLLDIGILLKDIFSHRFHCCLGFAPNTYAGSGDVLSSICGSTDNTVLGTSQCLLGFSSKSQYTVPCFAQCLLDSLGRHIGLHRGELLLLLLLR